MKRLGESKARKARLDNPIHKALGSVKSKSAPEDTSDQTFAQRAAVARDLIKKLKAQMDDENTKRRTKSRIRTAAKFQAGRVNDMINRTD